MRQTPNDWMVRVQIIRPDGTIQAANDYRKNNESDATEAAFEACQAALDIYPWDAPEGCDCEGGSAGCPVHDSTKLEYQEETT